MRVLGIIPARGGSKGLPGKNLMRLGGQTLIERAVRSAQESTLLTRIVVTSDDEAIRAEAMRCGAYAAVHRPAELATDEAGMIPTLQHAVDAMASLNETYDLIVCLQPTSPFRTGEDIDETIQLVTEGVDSAQTVVAACYHPGKMMQVFASKDVIHTHLPTALQDSRRQDCDYYQPSGSVYVVRRHVLAADMIIGQNHRALIVPWERSININTLWDFKIAEMILENR